MIWKIFSRLPSNFEDSKDFSPQCYQAGVIAIGWNFVRNLNLISFRDEITSRMKKHYGAKSNNRKIGQWAGTLWSFRNYVKAGDFVICPDKASQRYYVGRIRPGKVFFDARSLGGNCNFAHRRNVHWIRVLSASDILSVWPSGHFGGNQTLSEVDRGAQRFLAYLGKSPKPRTAMRSYPKLPTRPDMEWGREAEKRALSWLRSSGFRPKDVAHLNWGWDIDCGSKKFEIKGRKSTKTAIRLSENEWRAASTHGKNYTVLIFTASDKTSLNRANPVEIVDPKKNEIWTRRIKYEYVLAE